MADQQVMHGARAKIIIKGRTVGVFTQVTWSVNLDAVPIHILGKFGPAEITYTGAEAVNISASGFKIVDRGAYKNAGFPKLQELMTHEDFSLSLVDKKTNKVIFEAIECRPVGFDSGMAARSVSDFSVRFLALKHTCSSEGVTQNDEPGSANLTDE